VRGHRHVRLFSAFLVNDAICLVLAPLVLELMLAHGPQSDALPAGVAMASNVGSTATITGNPQNIMIGSFSRSLHDVRPGARAGGTGWTGITAGLVPCFTARSLPWRPSDGGEAAHPR